MALANIGSERNVCIIRRLVSGAGESSPISNLIYHFSKSFCTLNGIFKPSRQKRTKEPFESVLMTVQSGKGKEFP
jgi:hypothetical protein